ncbi:hypothetical protein BH23ACT6_BH23ACT6_26820 [soil metagenome]
MTTTPSLPRPDAHWREWISYGHSWARWSTGGAMDTGGSVDTGGTMNTGSSVDTDLASAGTAATDLAIFDTPPSGVHSRPADASPFSAGLQSWPITFYAYRELTPGPRWQALWQATRTAYLAFYQRDGLAQRPSLDESRAALARHMPELVPTYERLVDLTDGDELAARLLTMWRLPIFAAGCSQIAVGGEVPALVRNYDYDPNLFEGVISSTNYSGQRAVLGTSDMLWGLVDGMNDDGLAISMTYGGRRGGGVGFAIPLVIRFLLEVSSTVAEACERLQGLPVAQAYNLAMVDRDGARATVFVAPGEDPVVTDLAVSTNHRLDHVEHPEIAEPLNSLGRQRSLNTRLDAASGVDVATLQGWLGESPAFADRYSSGFGTLYTVAYEPSLGQARYRWGTRVLTRTFADTDTEFPVVLRGR